MARTEKDLGEICNTPIFIKKKFSGTMNIPSSNWYSNVQMFLIDTIDGYSPVGLAQIQIGNGSSIAPVGSYWFVEMEDITAFMLNITKFENPTSITSLDVSMEILYCRDDYMENR